MKTKRRKKGLFDGKRFEWMEKDRIKDLQSLNVEKSIRMTEQLIELANEFRHNYQSFPDNPVCLKLGLMKRKNG